MKHTLEFYEDDDGSLPVRDWLRELSITKKQVIGTAMREVLQELGVDVCSSEFGKQLGGGVFEFRVRQKPGDVRKGKKKLPPEAILLRVFCHAYGTRIILLLAAYDKGKDPTKRRQQREIGVARLRLARWKDRDK